MNAVQEKVEIKLPSTIEDFEVGDRVVWEYSRMSFGTVTKVDEGKLDIAMDCWSPENNILEVTENGKGDGFKDSKISQWRVFPNIATLEVGDVLSTTSLMYAWENNTNMNRFRFKITGMVRGKTIDIQSLDDPEYTLTLKGDNFSRILEDAIYDWDLEG